MSSPYHDAIIKAFDGVGANQTHCDRAGADGYTHVHGPNLGPQGAKCQNHVATVEKTSGTVSLYEPVAKVMGATKRESVRIREHPEGHSAGPSYGRFGYGFDAATILRRWHSFDEFAEAVRSVAQQKQRW